MDNEHRVISDKYVDNLTWYFEDGILYLRDNYEPYFHSYKYFYYEFEKIMPFVKCFEVSKGNNYFASNNGILYDKSMNCLLCVPPKMKGIIEIPNSVMHLEYNAFMNCTALRNVIIPEHVSGLWDAGMLGDCASLESIEVDSKNQSMVSVDGILYSRDMEVLIRVPCGSRGRVNIPDGVKRIQHRAFSHCAYLETVSIPDSVTIIDFEAFSGCKKLKSVEIPERVTKVGEYAFAGCENLVFASVPDSITSLEKDWSSDVPPQVINVNDSEESRQVVLERIFPGCNPKLKLRIKKTYSTRTWSSF